MYNDKVRMNPAFTSKNDTIIYKGKTYTVDLVDPDGTIYFKNKKDLNHKKVNVLQEFNNIEIYRKQNYCHPIPTRMIFA